MNEKEIQIVWVKKHYKTIKVKGKTKLHTTLGS